MKEEAEHSFSLTKSTQRGKKTYERGGQTFYFTYQFKPRRKEDSEGGDQTFKSIQGVYQALFFTPQANQRNGLQQILTWALIGVSRVRDSRGVPTKAAPTEVGKEETRGTNARIKAPGDRLDLVEGTERYLIH